MPPNTPSSGTALLGSSGIDVEMRTDPGLELLQLEPRLTKTEAWEIMKKLASGSITVKERENFQHRIVRCNGIQNVLPDELAEVYLLLSGRQAREYVMYFENGIRDGVIDPASIKWAMVLCLVEPATAYHKISDAIRRSLEHQASGLFGRTKWRRGRASAIVAEIDKSLAEIDSARSFARFFEATSPIPNTELDRESAILNGKEDLDLAGIRELIPVASPLLLVRIIDVASEKYNRGLLPWQMQNELMRACSRINSMTDVLEIAKKLDSLQGCDLFHSLKTNFLYAVRTFAEQPKNFLDAMYFWCLYGQKAGKTLETVSDLLLRELPVVHPAIFVRQFIAEEDFDKALVICQAAPDSCREKLQRELFPSRISAWHPNSLKLAAFIRATGRIITPRTVCDLAHGHGGTLAPVLRRMREILKCLGKSEEGIRVFERSCEEAFRQSREDREAHRRDRAREIINGETRRDVDAAMNSDLIASGEFVERLRRAYAAMTVPVDFPYRVATLHGLCEAMREDFLAGADWPEASGKFIETEEDSVLRRFGIQRIKFEKKAEGFNVQFIFDQGAFPGIVINEEGQAAMRHAPPDMTWIRELFETEALRLFLKLFNEGQDIEGQGLEEVLTVLGLRNFSEISARWQVPVEPDAIERDRQVPIGLSPAPEIPADSTAEFLSENLVSFQSLLDALRRLGVPIPGNADSIAGTFYETQARARIDRVIPPGGIQVQTQHILSQQIPVIDFYSVPQTREIMRRLNISPSNFHIAESMEDPERFDGYLAVLHVEIGQRKSTFYALVLPNFDVYLFGVDPGNIEEERDPMTFALLQLILDSFRCMVERLDNPANTNPRVATSGPDQPFGGRLTNVIADMTNSEYPPIVVSWNHEDQDRERGDVPRGGSDRNRSRALRDRFLEIHTSPGELPEVLASQGLFLHARDYLRIVPDAENVFPREAWIGEGRNRTLRPEYRDIYIPIDTPDAVQKVLIALKTSESLTCAPDLFRQIAAEVSKLEIDTPITQPEITEALRRMSILNPEAVFLAPPGAKSGATDYRLPYYFRERQSDSREVVFREAYDVTNITDRDVVTIISGNRAKLTAASRQWLIGSNRTPPINFAARAQNPYRRFIGRREISLVPRARALLVFEFSDSTFAFTYLDAARDTVNRKTAEVVLAATQKLQSFPLVRSAIDRTLAETKSGAHHDFDDMTRFSIPELIRLEHEGIVRLRRDQYKRVIGIDWAKPVSRKQVVIFEQEQVGYRQFQVEPTSMAEYLQFVHNECPGESVAGIPFNPRHRAIQQVIYELLSL